MTILAIQNQNKPSLTKNGNPYKPCRFGAITGALLSSVALVKSNAGDSFIKTGSKLLEESMKAKSFKDYLKVCGKNACFGAVAGLVAATVSIFGCLLGNALLDAPMNKELRDQADGEAKLMYPDCPICYEHQG